MSPDYGLKIAEAFQEYLKTGDESVIEKFSVKELKMAISMLSPHYDHNKLWYRELDRRIEKLNKLEASKSGKGQGLEIDKVRLLERLLFIAIGLIIGLMIK